MSNQQTFVIECCNNCGAHSWCTRHDEAKYESATAEVTAAIKSNVPNANVIVNKCPKPWYEKEVYCQLIPNDDDNNPNYDILPRIGAFEVSTVINNTDILFYSKQMSSMWPNATMLGKRIGEAMNDSNNMQA